MFGAIAKGIGQLGDPKTQKPLWISVLSALAVFVVLWFVSGTLIRSTAIFDIAWLESTADTLGWVLVVILTFALFPGVVSALVSLFLERIARSVEERHYPDLPEPAGQPVGEQVMGALKFGGMIVILNLLLLPFLLTGIYPILFYAVNGYLLGREYFELVAVRRMRAGDTQAMRKRFGTRIFLTGVAFAFFLTIPLINLLIPVVATAAMLHQFEAWRAQESSRAQDSSGDGSERAAHTANPNTMTNGGTTAVANPQQTNVTNGT